MSLTSCAAKAVCGLAHDVWLRLCYILPDLDLAVQLPTCRHAERRLAAICAIGYSHVFTLAMAPMERPVNRLVHSSFLLEIDLTIHTDQVVHVPDDHWNLIYCRLLGVADSVCFVSGPRSFRA